MPTTDIIKVENVSKKYRKQAALQNITFSMREGEVVGLVGPNGAGKSTLMSIISGLIRNYDGNVFIENQNIKNTSKRPRKLVGCVIETPGLYPHLTGYQNLKFFAEMSGGTSEAEIDKIIEMLGLKNAIHKKSGKYSLGMKQRLGIAQAVLGNPKILILDEPTNGLDPNVIPELRKFIKYISSEKGIAILISSHILSEIEAMCEKVIFIQNGSIVKQFLTNEKESDSSLITVVFETNDPNKLLKYFSSNKIEASRLNEKSITAHIDPSIRDSLVKDIVNMGISILGVYEHKQTLEEKFLKVMGGNNIE
ncbi:bacitracin ABC transporter ATP-binding protein [Bacillus pseudomycoides]|uniref:ABC transporter ATP-binding protein n=1 Tax=Bacillus pseudomycoides TaxID=64104 RepID=UPI000BF2C13F|nr:ABC transporter ATP-binding protein [Bacillus pseudomycoides]PFZ09487.1 bacitracin ABC transporter ATP-binding protein [Bacillus pseudomycoides]